MSSVATAHAFWITRPGHGEILSQQLPPPKTDEVRVRTLYSALSRGTESLVFAGRVPQSEYQRMRAPFQEGEFPGPVKFGYINVGVVESGPDLWRGRHVFSLFPHQTHFNISPNSIHVIPDGIPPERAVLGANLETALNALWDAELQNGARVTVVGAGSLGCLCAWLARHKFQAEVELLDIDPSRADVADRLGVNFAEPDQAQAGVPLILHTSASDQGLNTAIRIAGFEARIIELSWYGNSRQSISLGGAFHSQRLTIKASQVGYVAPQMRGRVSRHDRLHEALRFLSDSALDCLIDSQGSFTELPETLAEFVSGARTAICHRVHYDQQGE